MGELAMSCWVVPSVAAEFWGIPIAAVLEGARSGRIPFKTELGFTLVDVAPDSPRAETGFRQPATPPRTYAVPPSDELSEAEHLALSGEDTDAEAVGAEELAVLSETESSSELGKFDWRSARQRTSRQRRAPGVLQAAA